MRLPKYGDEIILARDLYRTKVLVLGNSDGSHDLQTDGRVLLTARFARRLADRLMAFAEAVEAKGAVR